MTEKTMTRCSEEMTSIIRAAVQKYGDDIPAAVTESLTKIRSLPDFHEWVDSLIRVSVQTLVYATRGSENQRIKESVNHPLPKVVQGSSQAVKEAYRSVFDISIGSMRLGSLKFADIPRLIASQENVARGFVENHLILKAINGRGRPEQSVEEVISKAEMESIQRRAQKESMSKSLFRFGRRKKAVV